MQPETLTTGNLITRWSTQMDPSSPLPEYPRPQLIRPEWINLNGPWDYAIRPKEEDAPQSWEGRIIVPFAVESHLSGVGRRVGSDHRLWYRRRFEAPSLPKGGRLLLHFGAVDWECNVWVNGTQVGTHRGGYDPFAFDVTEALNPEGPQELLVAVWDPTDESDQPRGKQSLKPHGIWYESVTGIWQTVWLEPVPAASVRSLTLLPDIDNDSLRVRVGGLGTESSDLVRIVAKDGEQIVGEVRGPLHQELRLAIPNPKLWSPSHPFLYDLEVEVQRGTEVVDRVASYFGMRKIATGKDAHGRPVLTLNNQPLFQFGPLDQGWWPDGLYTAPTDEALAFDVQATKDYGFNLIRKHVKVEPARWYYHCDRLGLLVWQDMPNANPARDRDEALWVAQSDSEDAVRSQESAAQFERELKAVIDALYSHPSIVMWVPFNEGWGQYETERVANWVASYDPSRLVNGASGWTDRGTNDVLDIHEYPGPSIDHCERDRVPVLGEFGGLGLGLPGHLWVDDGNWGYRSYDTQDRLLLEYTALIHALHGTIAKGLAAAVYTQTTDVEREVNGLITYDREVFKLDPNAVRSLNETVYSEAKVATLLVPTATERPNHPWRLTLERPADTDWTLPEYDDTGWTIAHAPFRGEIVGRLASVAAGTTWPTEEMWLRTVFSWNPSESANALWLEALFVVDQLELYINGKNVTSWKEIRDANRHYRHVDLSEHAHLIRNGVNTLAVHARRTDRRRGVDIGLYGV